MRSRWVRSLGALIGLALVASSRYVVTKVRGQGCSDTPSTSGAQSVPASPETRQQETSPDADPPDADPPDRTVRAERLTVDEIGSGELDGVWWPTSATATEAVPQLVDDLPDGLGRVQRVALPRADWSDEQPKAATVGGRPLRLAWFDGMRRHTARITFDTDAVITVLVLPPDTEQDAAESALRASAEERSRSQLLS